MTSTPVPIGEDDLQAYVDDRLPETRRAAVEAYLGIHPAIAARIAEERAHRQALRARRADQLAEPIPARLRIANIRAMRRARRFALLRGTAAAAVVLAVGAASGWFAREAVPVSAPSITARVTQDAVSAGRSPCRCSTAAASACWGGRLLPAGEDAAALLMYDDNAGTRLTVYIRSGASGEMAFRCRQEGEIETFAWLDRGCGFAVSAAADRARLLPIAEAVYRTLEPDPLHQPVRGG